MARHLFLDLPDVLGVKGAADVIGVHENTMWRYVKTGVIPAVKIGGCWRIKRSDVEKLLAGEFDNSNAHAG